jgi:hypothetical protein
MTASVRALVALVILAFGAGAIGLHGLSPHESFESDCPVCTSLAQSGPSMVAEPLPTVAPDATPSSPLAGTVRPVAFFVAGSARPRAPPLPA